MTRSALGATLAALLLAPAVGAQQEGGSAAASDSLRTAAITYISGQSIYVGAGRADGVREGMTLEVVRQGAAIATLRAAFLSSRSSSCEVIASTAAPAVGDSVRYRPVIERVVAASDSVPAGTSRRSTWRSPFRGHAGVRYLYIAQPNVGTAGTTMAQPSADVHVEAIHIGGTPLGFVVDGRGRRTIGGSASSAALDERTRVYEASLSFSHEGTGTRFSAGRQYSAALSSVSLFDGVTLELNQPHWGMGAFGGVQPDAATMGFGTSIREAGGYLQLHNAPSGSFPWSVTTGAVDSRELGQLNREYGFAQIIATSRYISVYATQEVDVNRGWKLDAGEPAFSPTSTFASVQVRLADAFSLQGGVDNRRNVRLYRDFVSPETEFDDAFREGFWGGANLSLFHRLRMGADARASRGGSAGAAEYYTGTLGLDPVSRLGLEARGRSTRFRTDRTEGWLHAWSAGVSPFGIVRLEVNGGLRTQQLLAAPAAPSTSLTPTTTLPDSRWIGGGIDIGVSRYWYLMVSVTRDGAGLDRTDQLYSSLVFRF